MLRRLLSTRSIAVGRCLFESRITPFIATTSSWPRQFSETATTSIQSAKETKEHPKLPSMVSQFHMLDKELREQAQGKFKEAYSDVEELLRRAPTFTVKDWHDFLCAISALGIHGGRIYFSSNHQSKMTDLVAQMTKCCGQFESIDYFNFIRLLLRFEESFNIWRDLPKEVQENVCSWFLKNYEQLEPSAFFEILLVRTQWLDKNKLFEIEKKEDVIKYLDHGVKLLLQQNGVANPLLLLHMIDSYGKIPAWKSDLQPLADRVLEILATRDYPRSVADLNSSLKFITGQQRRLSKSLRLTKTEVVFCRYAKNSPKTSWRWLRNSIELTFASEEYSELRQLAAYSAVEAKRLGAIDFDVDDLVRFISVASEPFLKNPAYVLEQSNSDGPSVPRTVALTMILEAINRGLACEPKLSDRLPLWVRFDEAYWDRFFVMLKTEAPKLGSNRWLIMGAVSKALAVKHMRYQFSRNKIIICKALNLDRMNIMRQLTVRPD